MTTMTTERFPSRQRITFRAILCWITDNIPRMADIHSRINERLRVTGKSPRRAGIDGGLSGDAIGKMLKKPEQSQTLESIRKLAVGLETTPEWLAFGIQEEGESRNREQSRPQEQEPLYKSRLRDSDCIQVEKRTLRSLLTEALLELRIPARKAEAYADGVLGYLEERQDATVVVRLMGSARSATGSRAPALGGPS